VRVGLYVISITMTREKAGCYNLKECREEAQGQIPGVDQKYQDAKAYENGEREQKQRDIIILVARCVDDRSTQNTVITVCQLELHMSCM